MRKRARWRCSSMRRSSPAARPPHPTFRTSITAWGANSSQPSAAPSRAQRKAQPCSGTRWRADRRRPLSRRWSRRTLSRRGEIDLSLAALQGSFAPDVEEGGEKLAEDPRVVVVVLVLPVGQQSLHHLVLARHELDDDRAAKFRQPADELRQWNVGRNHDVMDERQAQHQLGPPALDKALALGAAPALAGRSIGKVDDQRQDVPRPAPLTLIEPL